jgi:hypothetical protein
MTRKRYIDVSRKGVTRVKIREAKNPAREPLKIVDPFLADRGLVEGFLVFNAARWVNLPNSRGGFQPIKPTSTYSNPHVPSNVFPAGYLWPTREAAKAAATAMLKQYPDRRYVVFKAVSVVESAPPIEPLVREFPL